MSDNDISKRPRPTVLDKVYLLAQSASSVDPRVGVPASVFFALVDPPLTRRTYEWVESIGKRLVSLEQRVEGLSVDDLSHDEGFVSTLLHASQVALRSHHEEKLQALRNAVLNSALPNAPDEDLQQMFLNYIDMFTPWHLRMLVFAAKLERWVERRAESKRDAHTFSRLESMLQAEFPQLEERQDFVAQVKEDLLTRGIIQDNLWWEPTRMGDAFLRFVQEPPVLRTGDSDTP